MFPFASAGGRQLRRTNRLETNTGTTSLGAEGRTLELGIAREEEEEAVRGVGAMDGKCAGRQNISKHRMVHSKGRKKHKGKQPN